ncbi:hypothetical protein BHE74_00036988 [Ensete ventricosum]|nr:hypothetical protein GW17_00011279 [Ensete ventricosum]RWW56304.1 hypothetical protein BHE74_00036988 [Ensete ventricosum]RZR75742.1 hypothetical protein BHM03_00000222 [Ensete ventricosum]
MVTPHSSVSTGRPEWSMRMASCPKASLTFTGPTATSKATSLMNTVDLAAAVAAAAPLDPPTPITGAEEEEEEMISCTKMLAGLFPFWDEEKIRRVRDQRHEN